MKIFTAHFWFKVFRSFTPAMKGIASGFQERNMKVHGLAFLIVFSAGFFFKIEVWEWLFIVLAVGLVMAAELMNTAIEELSNILRDDLNMGYESTRRARDVAAGAVLVLTIVAIALAVVIFLPRIFALFF